MALSADLLQIKALGFDAETDSLDDSITDGVNFNHTGRFLIISDKEIKKNSSVYMEFTIKSYTKHNDIRHIPLMVGVHKEPSSGVVNADYCLGSIYYTKNSWYTGIDDTQYLAFKVEEKYAGRFPSFSYVQEIHSRLPIKESIIGIGVNMLYNSISIYVDGILMYSFSPTLQNMNNEESNYYFAIYSPELGKNIQGSVNYGRYGVQYLPNGYISFYQNSLIGKNYIYDISSSIKVGNRFLYNGYDNDVLFGHISIDNQLAPISPSTENYRRDLEMINNHDGMTYYVDLENMIINKHAFQFKPQDNEPDRSYINFPMDKYKRLYFEFHCAEADLINDYMGCPISIGITKDPTNYNIASMKINLFHLRSDTYHIESIQYGYEYIHGNYFIANPIYPSQPNTIGILIDLYINTIEIYTESLLFSRIESPIIDFSDPTETAYIFFEAPPNYIFTGTGHIICNFGTQNTSDKSYKDDKLQFQDLYDNISILDLWYYYNYPLKIPYHKEPDRVCEIRVMAKVISDRLLYGKNIYASIIVPEEDNEWSPGLNKMWGTYNKISKAEEVNNLPDRSIYSIHKLIEEDKENNRR